MKENEIQDCHPRSEWKISIRKFRKTTGWKCRYHLTEWPRENKHKVFQLGGHSVFFVFQLVGHSVFSGRIMIISLSIRSKSDDKVWEKYNMITFKKWKRTKIRARNSGHQIRRGILETIYQFVVAKKQLQKNTAGTMSQDLRMTALLIPPPQIGKTDLQGFRTISGGRMLRFLDGFWNPAPF